MSDKFKSVLVMMVFLGTILLSSCATKKDDQVQPIPPPAQTCEQRCDAEYDECYVICASDPDDDYCDWGFCEDDYDECLSYCD